MSQSNKDKTEGGQNGTAESGASALKALGQIAAHLGKTAMTPEGNLTEEASLQVMLRDPSSRGSIVEQFIRELTPSGINGEALKRWLDGGRSPFVSKPNKAGHESENPGQTLTRLSDRIRTQERRVATAQGKVDSASEELKDAERQLVFLKAFENAALEWHVFDKLIEIMLPALAMGPAWTIMRALSGYVSDEAADKATDMFFGDEKVHTMAEYRVMRVKETAEMFSTLDGLSGVDKFEEALRDAVLKVCRDFEGRREELVTDGRRPRSAKAMKESAHPKAQADAEEVLEGLPTG